MSPEAGFGGLSPQVCDWSSDLSTDVAARSPARDLFLWNLKSKKTLARQIAFGYGVLSQQQKTDQYTYE